MPLYEATIPQLRKMLGNVDRWLVKASAFAAEKSMDEAMLLAERLAPDQFPLVKQVQAACDQAKTVAALLAGKEAPKHPDTEKTIEELRARIKTCRSYLETITAADFEGAESRPITLPFVPGKVITGANYLNEMALPNFYFHVTTAYAILRHKGLGLGKLDLIGRLTFADP